jgi:hypothetical protein
MSITYDQIWSMQEAINMAVEENRVVRFLSDKPNTKLKKEIVDIRGCKLMKKDKDSNDIAVIPPGIENFDFDDINMSSSIWLPKGGIS